jgi:enoyl-CoA hydratase
MSSTTLPARPGLPRPPARAGTRAGVSLEVRHRTALLRMDDAKANAITPDWAQAFSGALDRAEAEAEAVVITGRPDWFCAGFHRTILTSGVKPFLALLAQTVQLLERLYSFPMPVVAACTGHALGSGAVLLLACDHRVGADGPFKIGLNELALGLPVPGQAIEMARERLVSARLVEATLGGRLYDPSAAAGIGFLDEIAPTHDVLRRAAASAATLAVLPREAFATTKLSLRSHTLARISQMPESELERMMGLLSGVAPEHAGSENS